MSEIVKKENLSSVKNRGFIAAIYNFFRNYPIILVVIVASIILSFVAPNFLTKTNIMNVLRQVSMIAILAVGAYFVLVGGNFDLSAGATVGFVSCIFAMFMSKWNINPYLSIIISIVIGIAMGCVNGLLVAKLKIPAFIATLGTMSINRGAVYVMTNNYSIGGTNEKISFLGTGYFLGIPVPVLIMVVIFCIAEFISQSTKYGRFLYSTGGNKEAAYMAGINTTKIVFSTFAISGLFAAISAVILTARVASGQPNAGIGWESEAITAAVIGGVSIYGGVGRVFGVLFGAVLIGILNNGMILLDISPNYQQIIKGLVLILAIGFDVLKAKKNSR
jgi:ribose transport system permease protein